MTDVLTDYLIEDTMAKETRCNILTDILADILTEVFTEVLTEYTSTYISAKETCYYILSKDTRMLHIDRQADRHSDRHPDRYFDKRKVNAGS